MPNWTTFEGNLRDKLPMRLFLAEHEGRLSKAILHDDEHTRHESGFDGSWQRWAHGDGPEILQMAARQVTEYFIGTRQQFDLPLAFHGTPFQIRVWNELLKIPFGTTCSYQDLARDIGQDKAVRAVGSANGRNNLPLFVPCHRVIASNGNLAGFTGGVGLKRRLLAHEAAVGNQDAVPRQGLLVERQEKSGRSIAG